MNKTMTESTRKYSDNIPESLRNRPAEFIKHIMSRLQDARELDLKTIKYQISMEQNPTCSCIDFSRKSYPCKHIIAHWLDEDGVLTLPDDKSQIWWTVDEEIGNTNDISQAASPEECTNPSPKNHITSKNQAKSTKPKVANELRAILEEIKQATYLCPELVLMEQIKPLKEVLDKLKTKIPKEQGLTALPGKKQAIKRKVMQTTLPKSYKKKRSSWTGRVGVLADSQRNRPKDLQAILKTPVSPNIV